MVDGGVLIVQFAGLVIDDAGIGDGSLDACEERVGVSLGRRTAVIAVEHGGIVGVRSEYGDGLHILG